MRQTWTSEEFQRNRLLPQLEQTLRLYKDKPEEKTSELTIIGTKVALTESKKNQLLRHKFKNPELKLKPKRRPYFAVGHQVNSKKQKKVVQIIDKTKTMSLLFEDMLKTSSQSVTNQ